MVEGNTIKLNNVFHLINLNAFNDSIMHIPKFNFALLIQMKNISIININSNVF